MTEFKMVKAGALFELKSNPQLNKEKFTFIQKGYPYFTRTSFNNGILGYVEYLDEEHKINGNSLAIGMIEMKFHYMETDFYAGQFTKTAFPKFDGFNKTVALYFITLFSKHQSTYQGILIRDFEKVFNDTEISLPIKENHKQIENDIDKIDFEYMTTRIRELELARIRELELARIRELVAYLKVTGLTDYQLTTDEEQFLNNYRTPRGGGSI